MAELDFASAREIVHFSHPRCIMELTTIQGRGAIDKCCSGCMKPIGEGLAYHCHPCNFLLHFTCSQIPQQISHRADAHLLQLLPQPWNYAPSGTCRCNACWQPITQGFSFHCSICRLDLHPSCANLPMEYNHPHHQRHKLHLSFTPPYQGRDFRCNVCQISGGCWHYHCSECHFDSHVNCTQIPLLRESLLNETSRAINRAYVNNGGGHQQHPPFQHEPYNHNNTRGNVFARPVIGMIMQTVFGSVLQAFVNPGGGGNGWGLDSFGDLSHVIGSLFGFGFF